MHWTFYVSYTALTLMVCGCSSSSFSVGALLADTSEDTQRTADGSILECTRLDSNTTDIYVNSASDSNGTGTQSCPFQSIKSALEIQNIPPNGRTIHVDGLPNKLIDYLEPELIIPTNVTVLGENGRPKIIGSITVKAGARLNNLTVVNIGKPNLFARPALIVEGTVNNKSSLTDVNAIGPVLNGNQEKIPAIGVLGDTNLVNVSATDSDIGLATPILLTAIKPIPFTISINNDSKNGFTKNRVQGIYITGLANLQLTGGIISNNQGNGIEFNNSVSTNSSPATHKIHEAIITQNGLANLTPPGSSTYAGVWIRENANLSLRNSTILNNRGFGVWFVRSSLNVLDIGTSIQDPGGNIFSRKNKTEPNDKASLCIDYSGVTNIIQMAIGNSWSKCTSVETLNSITDCRSVQTSIAYDIAIPSTVKVNVTQNNVGCTEG